MIKLYNFDELKPEEILNRDIRAEKNVEDVVDGIIADVRARGDEALKDYALKFDGAKIQNLQETQAEIDVLMPYLPAQLSEDEIRALVKEAVEKTGASSPKDMGKVMGMLMPKVKGRADGKMVNTIVRSMLQG